MTEPDVAEPAVDLATGQAAARGYRPPPRYRTVRAHPDSVWGGQATASAPLEVTIRSNLTGAELDWIKAAGKDEEIRARLAPYVVGWNCEGPVVDPATGAMTWRRLPPPAEAGPDVFRDVDVWTVAWIKVQLERAPYTLSDDDLKAWTPSGQPHAGASSAMEPSGSDAPSPTPSPSSRGRRRTSSPTPAAST